MFCRAARAFQVACIMDSGQKEDSRNIYLLTFSAVSKQTKWYYDDTALLRTWASEERERDRDRDRERKRDRDRQTTD